MYGCGLMEIVFMITMVYVMVHFFRTPICGFIFQCGCSFGRNHIQQAKHCNVHNIHGPYCPFCNANKSIGWLISKIWIIFIVNMIYIFVFVYHSRKNVSYNEYQQTNDDELLSDIDFSLTNMDMNMNNKYCNGKQFLKRFLITVTAFILYNIIMGLFFWLGTHYPTYFFIHRQN